MEKRKWSRAFESYMNNFVSVVKNAPENTVGPDGKQVFYFADFKTFPTKNSLVKNSTFELKGHCDEAVRFKINQAGTFLGAEYIDFGRMEDGKPHVEYVGKDADKLAGLMKNDVFKGLVSRFDWSKSAELAEEAELTN